MGVIYHAHARFFDAKGNKITVPAPVDPDTPNALWWYDYIATKAAEWAAAGFTAVMFPPVCKTQSGSANTGDGYGVYDQYDIGWKKQCYSVPTRFGTREQLQRAVAACHASGMDVYADMVMHQLEGGNNGVYEYLGADGETKNGRFPKAPGCFRGNPPRRPEDAVPVPYYDFAFGDEFVYQNCDPPGYTINGMIEWGDWLTRTLDLQGYRVDDTKGTWVPFVKQWMTSKAMASRWCTSEYFDGNPTNLAWWVWDQMGGRSSVYDFTLHWALQSMCAGGSMQQMDGAGFAARSPFNAVTFVDNPDTDTSPGQAIVSSKLLAYAYILTTEGYPSVYHKDYAEEPNCYGLKPYIDNLVWIHENLANGPTQTRYVDGRVIVLERTGSPGLLTAISNDPLSAHTLTVPTAFQNGWLLHDYTGRHPDVTVESGQVTFTIQSNYFSGGQSYLCFAPAGLGKPISIRPRSTVQEFFGADDLDIGPLTAGSTVTLPRISVRGNSPVELTLHMPRGFWIGTQSVTMDATDEGGDKYTFTWHANQSTFITTNGDGWLTIALSAAGTNLPSNFTLQVRYICPKKITI